MWIAIAIGLLIMVLIAAYLARPRPVFCPTCGGEIVSDHEVYQHTILHTCKVCGKTYETLRQGEE